MSAEKDPEGAQALDAAADAAAAAAAAEAREAREAGEVAEGGEAAEEPSPLRGVYTPNLLVLFEKLQRSILVTTYQAGKLVLLRFKDGTLNTHYRNFTRPMGLDATRKEIAIGTQQEVMFFENVPAVIPRIEPAGPYDACFVPRRTHTTGFIDIHEMAFDASGVLWIVNTSFGCLATLDPDYSFVPRWRPRFLSALSPEDRCHLNGLSLVDGAPRYVTALGETDTPGGWRDNKKDGGVLIDIQSDEIICRGLSMPHSPRWYRNQLWVLESGLGAIGRVDLRSGKVETVCELPGFTRGLDFVGPYAFIGLSQVRETAVFSGLPVTERAQERNSGVWVVNIETGENLGFVRFEGEVREIFAVKALPPGIACPELLEPSDPLVRSSYVLPDAALAQVPKELLALDAARDPG